MTTSNRSRVLGAALLAAAVFATDRAHAEPTAADLESARELYREGKELRQKGDLRAALERFKAAHGYGQTPVTGLELGKTHLQLGELVEAREVLLSIARLKVASDETEKSAGARTEAAELAEQTRTRVPTIVVKVTGVKPGTDPIVTIDGATVPVVSFSSTRKVNPGEHAISVRVANQDEKRTLTLAESEVKEVVVAIPEASAASADTSLSASPQSSIHPVTIAGIGVAAVGLAVGTVTGILALGKASRLEDACQGLSCPPSARADVDDGRTFATVSTISFVVAAVGLAASAVGFFVLTPRSRARAWIEGGGVSF
jgi:hypothetical protein